MLLRIRRRSRWLFIGTAVTASVAVAACQSGTAKIQTGDGASDDPWRTSVTYADPDGRFEIEFPSEPEPSEERQGGPGREFTLHSLRSTVGADWEFDLAWSDAPAGTPLVETQEIAPGTAQANAERDGSRVTDEHDVEQFGLTGLEFTVQGDGHKGLYRDRQVVVGGRLYELTVIQRTASSAAFERFVDSFRLLEPPVGENPDFFAAAEEACAAFFVARSGPAPDATPGQRGVGVLEVATFFETLAEQLAGRPASVEDQGRAAAFIDATRRSIEPARAFAQAVSADDPNAPALGQATHADTDLSDQLAKENGAPSCA